MSPTRAASSLARPPVWRPKNYDDATAETIDETVRRMIDEAFATALEILKRSQALLEESAKDLLAHETLGPE